MHTLLYVLGDSTTTATTAAKSGKSSGGNWTLPIIIALFAVVYFAFLRPRQQRMRQRQRTTQEIGVGDEVMSAGGIYGTVVGVQGDAVEVEVSPGVVLTFTKRAISARPGAAAAASSPSDDGDHDDGDGSDHSWDEGHEDEGEESPTGPAEHGEEAPHHGESGHGGGESGPSDQR